MGASTSSEPRVSAEQNEAESVAASTGALPMLQNAFSKLANPQTNAVPLENLQQRFSFAGEGRSCSGSNVPDSLTVMLDHLGSILVDQFFVPDKGGINWVEFVKSYNKCCARVSSSVSLNMLLRVFVAVSESANVPIHLEFESGDTDCKINGHLLPSDVFLLLALCWVMSWGSRNLKGEGNLSLPDLNHLVLSVITSCGQVEGGLDVWDRDISSLEAQLPAGKFVTWVMNTVPCLPDCLRLYFNARLQIAATDGVELAPSDSSSVGVISSIAAHDYLLTQGRAWAISITNKSRVNEEISGAFISNGGGMGDKLVYRSSTHGRGLGRFWSRVEGYKGPLLILISASSGEPHEGNSVDRKWVIGVLTDQAFESKDIFYGNSGCLYSIDPVFHVFPPIGKEKNFVYSHLHPTGKVYQPHPKPVGLAFGGTLGNERIFIDEDFSKVTVRHHSVDKTYRSGSLLPDQGFLPVEGIISVVEVWGLGGKAAKQVQDSFKKREELFTEQRRKVDLKTFANWEDSPEKMMMDMMSDPNAVRREDR
ncbi:hypothetical protein PHAVU_009G147800 [Phaseolus vulgaris]|uniref:TLDc domain-containing protein n=1 Tax=Phaseolus vulgaris TaxID=3885 RepID=V7AVM0_PHAVU|nr:hypothetical protein PHAVU_009G147800g [Phaseolus vulgaris]ESW09687.1 hypothetical protein PHAVU_009G147800g [Phaseolus vulgaris]